MKITRTYPQPDSPAPHIGPRERAMAVFKYLLDLEPEAAVKHERFNVIVHAFAQEHCTGWNSAIEELGDTEVDAIEYKPLTESLCEQIATVREVLPAEIVPIQRL